MTDDASLVRDAYANGLPIARSEALAIVSAGILAPSADNRHVVQFDIRSQEIRLVSRPDFARAPSHRRVLGWIAVGAVVETMRVDAHSRGLQLHCSWFPSGMGSDPIAILRFTGVQAKPDAQLVAAIGRRHTNRRVAFRGPALSDAERSTLDRALDSIGGVQLTWLTARPARKEALRLLGFAETQRFLLQPLHQELFATIRFDLGWRRSADEGLAPGSLAIEPPMRPLFASLRRWPVMRALQLIGAHRMIGMRAAYLPCRLAPELAVLSTRLGTTLGALAVGEALQRLWLHATAQGWALQPFAAPALLALEEYAEVPRSVRERLARGWARLVPGMLPLIVFRMGRAAAMEITNGRRPLEEYLRSADQAMPG
ncbi:MAG TPA: hypothetical protein VMV45_18540 [Casimicrobiaceae bacterium]|nr:hypothetical protein [Casimicrobiaceae bacterium]